MRGYSETIRLEVSGWSSERAWWCDPGRWPQDAGEERMSGCEAQVGDQWTSVTRAATVSKVESVYSFHKCSSRWQYSVRRRKAFSSFAEGSPRGYQGWLWGIVGCRAQGRGGECHMIARFMTWTTERPAVHSSRYGI